MNFNLFSWFSFLSEVYPMFLELPLSILILLHTKVTFWGISWTNVVLEKQLIQWLSTIRLGSNRRVGRSCHSPNSCCISNLATILYFLHSHPYNWTENRFLTLCTCILCTTNPKNVHLFIRNAHSAEERKWRFIILPLICLISLCFTMFALLMLFNCSKRD